MIICNGNKIDDLDYDVWRSYDTLKEDKFRYHTM